MINLNKVPFTSIFLSTVLVLIYVAIGFENNQFIKLSINALVIRGGNFSGLTLGKENWRLVSSIFLHGSILHLLINLYSLITLGFLFEKKLGSIWFLVFFILFGISGSVGSLIWNDYVVSVGSSGALFGLIGFYMFFSLNSFSKPNFKDAANMFVVIVVNLIVGFKIDTIDNGAHIGGLILGVFVGFIFFVLNNTQKFHPNFKHILGTTLALVGLIVLFINLPKYRAEYYDYYQFFLDKEQKSIELQGQKKAFSNPLYDADLTTCYTYWQEIKDSLNNLNFIEIEGVKEDTSLMYLYIDYQQKVVTYMKKVIEFGSFTYLDSVHITNHKIRSLPMFNYPLNFNSKIPKKDTLIDKLFWFDHNWVEIDDPKIASYSRSAKLDSMGRLQGNVYDKYADGSLQMTGHYYNNVMNGVFFYFYPNRQYQAIGIMSNDYHVGKWQYFYKNGQLKSEKMFEANGNTKTLSFWNENGVQTVFNGNGSCDYLNEVDSVFESGLYSEYLKQEIWSGSYFNKTPYYEEIYNAGNLQEGRSLSKTGNKYYYSSVVEFPTPAIGWDNYYKYIDSALVPFVDSLPKYVFGKSSIRLHVDTTGNIIEIIPAYIVGFGLEEKIIQLIKNKPDFVSGKLRGQRKSMRTFVYVRI